MYVPTIRNILILDGLIKNEFKCVLISDKIAINKNEIMVVDSINKNSSFVTLLESNASWHVRLRHVNYKIVRKLISLEVLPKFECNKLKCETRVEYKFVKHPYISLLIGIHIV